MPIRHGPEKWRSAEPLRGLRSFRRKTGNTASRVSSSGNREHAEWTLAGAEKGYVTLLRISEQITELPADVRQELRSKLHGLRGRLDRLQQMLGQLSAPVAQD